MIKWVTLYLCDRIGKLMMVYTIDLTQVSSQAARVSRRHQLSDWSSFLKRQFLTQLSGWYHKCVFCVFCHGHKQFNRTHVTKFLGNSKDQYHILAQFCYVYLENAVLYTKIIDQLHEKNEIDALLYGLILMHHVKYTSMKRRGSNIQPFE